MKIDNYSTFRNTYQQWFINGPTTDTPTSNIVSELELLLICEHQIRFITGTDVDNRDEVSAKVPVMNHY
jgi:hypothetical protein